MSGTGMRRVVRRLSGSRLAAIIGVIVVLSGLVFGTGLLLGAHASTGNAGKFQFQRPKPSSHELQDESKWFQLSHIGNKPVKADARTKALQQAHKLPVSHLGTARVVSNGKYTIAPNSASNLTGGGTWFPLGPQELNTGPTSSGGYGIVSGRITAEAINPSNANDIWVGAADGGVWHSTNGGNS